MFFLIYPILGSVVIGGQAAPTKLKATASATLIPSTPADKIPPGVAGAFSGGENTAAERIPQDLSGNYF